MNKEFKDDETKKNEKIFSYYFIFRFEKVEKM